MTQRVNIIATEQATPTTAGAASSISKATCVRLYNQTGGEVVVNVSATVSAASTNQFTMAAGRTEFLEKLPTDVIFTSGAIKAAKVGFTN